MVRKAKIIIRSVKDLSRSKSKRTSIGNSPNSRPTNKHKKKNWKKYRGQG
tara:strand:+ start:432 stop:581 length:150 start_codon:yes stop_codon:yes gene_type:complete